MKILYGMATIGKMGEECGVCAYYLYRFDLMARG
jgi:hypothetical protein